MDAGNALELLVSANPSIGSETVIEANLMSLNGYPVSGSLVQAGTRAQSVKTLYYYFPQMAQGFMAEGTVSLTFGKKRPTGSRVHFSVRAGTIPCNSSGNPPMVSITNPAAGGAFSAPATVSVTADAQDSDGTVAQVAFYANGTPIGTATSSPYTIQWANVQFGAYSLTAVATDNEGLQTTSAGVPITVGAAQALYFIHVDHLNTPRLVADSAQKTVWRWDQQELFGNNPANEDPDGDAIAFSFPRRLPGQHFDGETKLLHNYFRDYDSEIGRYVQSDPIGLVGGINIYTYVDANPLSATDPFGLAPPRPGSWYNPLPIPGQGPPSIVQNQGGLNNAIKLFEDLPTGAPGAGGWPGINVPWSLPPGIPNYLPICGWDCPRSPVACSVGDPPPPVYDSFFAPRSGCIWRCRPGPFIGPQ